MPLLLRVSIVPTVLCRRASKAGEVFEVAPLLPSPSGWGTGTCGCRNGEAAGLYLPASALWACERPTGTCLPG